MITIHVEFVLSHSLPSAFCIALYSMDSIVQSSPVDQIAYFALEPNVYIALPVVLLFLTTIAVALRIYVRAVILDRLGLDDYTLLLAYVGKM